ncbi:putative bifunctional diguanylate cyclase/phosphodiesterase [Alkalimonas amylolytica]|uniref:Diguanylate cyclase (GGDEF) domain-containing protein n=1 Tax=Alkalimonas amylolytica TaxID=152573 RepID=A0A1H3Z890_ALKAM|nr:GGDEF domain-containing phosphodiesterase [Alkalimonas amylolytica]SEA19885.1 diguanylate cyclase (GGDEF) domain-containing protein [Alkalimonas amylolytica]
MLKPPSSFKQIAATVLLFQDMKSRVAQVRAVIGVFIILFLFISISDLLHSNGEWIIESLAIIGLLLGLTWLLNGDTSNIVAGMVLWTVAIFALSKAFYYDGLYDTSLLLYPFVLIFAVFFGSWAMVLPLTLFMFLSFFGLAYAVTTELVVSNVSTHYSVWAKAIDMAAIIAVYGLGIVVITRFMKGLIAKLSRQKALDQAARKESERRMLYDDLTGLPNNQKCKADLNLHLSNSRKNGSILSFITLHMNDFNWINATLGHDFGSELLVQLTRRFLKLEDDSTFVYRTGGAEFTFIKQVRDFAALNDFCHQAIRTTTLPLSLSDYDYDVGCWLGAAVAPFDGNDFVELYKKAQFAVYKAKETELNSYQFYERQMEESTSQRLAMVKELKHAIEHNEFELYYQPKVELASNLFVGAEALIRWNKNGAIIPPNTFIPVAEHSGLIVEIGKWAIETACAECAKWHQLGFARMTVAVNLSPVQFKRGNLPNHVFRALQKHQLDASMLELEITESLFIEDAVHVKQQIHTMAQKGVNFAIDDFGTGYSNLNYLANFNASTLKIDMSFVRNMLSNPQQQHIVNAIIKMSSAMGLVNVAEGIEDAETAAELKTQGCAYGQGYFWAPPLPCAEFLSRLQQQSA